MVEEWIKMEKLTMEKLVNLCKNYGFIFQGSEIYDGLANTWDYGPVGIKHCGIKDLFKKTIIATVLMQLFL